MWSKVFTLEDLNRSKEKTVIDNLGIVFTEIGDDYLKATMPVDERTHQPIGILHGGASVVLAETLGSVCANRCAQEGQYCVGLEINANHIRAKRSGVVTGIAKAKHIGSSTQVWVIDIVDEQEKLICTSRITMAVLKK